MPDEPPSKPPIDSPFATAAEVAEFLRISRKTFMRHVAEELDYIEVGARQIWVWESVYDWVDRNAVHVKPRLPAQEPPPRPPGRPGSRGLKPTPESERAARLRSRLNAPRLEPPKPTQEESALAARLQSRLNASSLEPDAVRQALLEAGVPMTPRQIGLVVGLRTGLATKCASDMHRRGELTRERAGTVWAYRVAEKPASGRR